jgi:hypothetical protein
MARPRIFATGVYGSDFDLWGAQSFSDAKTRDKLGRIIGPNDYCLTIGMTSQNDVPEHERGRLLALVKIGPEPIMTEQLVHPRKWQESLKNYGDRWRFGFPIRSVERFDDRPLRSDILPRIGRENLYRVVGRHFVELTPQEVTRVLALPRTPDTNIYTTPVSAFASRLLGKRRGPRPSRKTRTLSPKSGPAVTYCLELAGTLAGPMKEALGLSPNEQILKIGFSTSLDRRADAINSYLPCEEALCWKPMKTQWHEDEINAWSMEQQIFDLIEQAGIERLKGEIVCLSPDKLNDVWEQARRTAKRPSGKIAVEVDDVNRKVVSRPSRKNDQ